MFKDFNGTRNELLNKIADAANSEQIGIGSVIKLIDRKTQEKYNIKEDEYIREFTDDVRGTILAGYWIEKPKINVNEEEIKKNNKYIRHVWIKAIKIMNREDRTRVSKGLEYLIENNNFSSWENLNEYINNNYPEV